MKVARNGGNDPATIHYRVAAGANTLLGANTNFIPRIIRVLDSGNLHVLDDSNTWITYAVTAGEEFRFRALRIGASTTCNVACWG